MTRQNTWAALLLTTLALVACGDEDPSGSLLDGGSDMGSANGDGGDDLDAAPPGPDFSLPDMEVDPNVLPIEDLPNAIADAICNDACPSPMVSDRFPVELLVQGESAECEERLAAAIYRAFLNGHLISTAATATYDGAAARACIDRIAATPCASRFELFGSHFCGGAVFTTSPLVGDPCDPAGVDACPANAYCHATSGTNACGGTCREALAPGADCSDGIAECASGSACLYNDADESIRCRTLSVASARAALGDDCGTNISATTAEEIYCAPELLCQDGESGERCVAAADEGELCDNDSIFCRPPYECTEGTCRERSYVAEAGAQCGIVTGYPVRCDALAGFGCVRENEETLSYVCASVGDGTAGTRCLPDALAPLSGTSCDVGLFCDLAPGDDLGECRALLTNGASCERDSECASQQCTQEDEGSVCSDLVCEIGA